MKQTVFEFKYNPDTYDSAAFTISVHKTKKGAEMAMEFHRANTEKEHKELYKGEIDNFGYDFAQWWGVEETELLD